MQSHIDSIKNIIGNVKVLPAAATVVVTMLFAFLSLSCSKERQDMGDDGEANITLTVSAGTRSINEDQVLWEDRVDELRMLVFDPGDGSVVINQKLYFPAGFNEQSRAVRITPGTYDFYFIANETVYAGDFVNALMDIENVSEFASDSRFLDLAYRPGFVPDGTTSDGRFLMSAVYEDIEVLSGGTETNPVLLPLPTATVELIRSLAKVEVVFRKRVPGSAVAENTVSSVRLANVASDFSVPPEDAYYSGSTVYSPTADLTGFDYASDSIGAVTFYIPEFLLPQNDAVFTQLEINNISFPIENDNAFGGLTRQRRSVSPISNNSVIRNYHYLINAYINAEGGIQIKVFVEPWVKDTYIYLFHGDLSIVVPPIEPTDSSIVIPTDCGTIEILSDNESLSQGLMGALNYQINYYNPETGGPEITGGDPPYYCEKKYGPGWRLINSCELMSFLAYTDMAYTVWTSNTWLAEGHNVPYYPRTFRQEAQFLLEKLTGFDLSSSVLYNEYNHQDVLADEKLGIIDKYFTPGDILLKPDDYAVWPFPGQPATGSSEGWIYNEATIQVKAYWYGSSYISPIDRDNWYRILYGEFERFDFSSTVSRCVREID